LVALQLRLKAADAEISSQTKAAHNIRKRASAIGKPSGASA